MAPRAQRTPPPYMQIYAHYRQLIASGQMPDGQQLPTVKVLASEWGTATATVGKAIAKLAAEGYVRTTPQGTFATSPSSTYTPHDRVRSLRRRGHATALQAQRAIVRSAEVVVAPDKIADQMGIPRGSFVLRRERVAYRGERAVETSVSWLPVEFAEAIPELAALDPIEGGTAGRIFEVTGRAVRYSHEERLARPATEAEARELGLDTGVPVMAGTNTWTDDLGLIEFGEFVVATGCRHIDEYVVDDSDGPDEPGAQPEQETN